LSAYLPGISLFLMEGRLKPMTLANISLLLLVLFLFATIASAAPIPREASLARKELKQLRLKRGEPTPVKRAGSEPSSKPYKRDAAVFPRASKVYRA